MAWQGGSPAASATMIHGAGMRLCQGLGFYSLCRGTGLRVTTVLLSYLAKPLVCCLGPHS
jgi:hypothetical protein